MIMLKAGPAMTTGAWKKEGHIPTVSKGLQSGENRRSGTSTGIYAIGNRVWLVDKGKKNFRNRYKVKKSSPKIGVS